MNNIGIDQWILIILAFLTLLFGTGLIFRFKSRHKKEGKSLPSDEKPEVRKKRGLIQVKPKIRVGDFMDIPLRWDDKIRINVLDIVQDKFEIMNSEEELDCVDLEINIPPLIFKGVSLYGGKYTKEIASWRYRIPASKFSDERLPSLYIYSTGKDSFDFLRIFAVHINRHAMQVVLDIFYCHR